jgi:hypothetical protein
MTPSDNYFSVLKKINTVGIFTHAANSGLHLHLLYQLLLSPYSEETSSITGRPTWSTMLPKIYYYWFVDFNTTVKVASVIATHILFI